MVRNEREQAWKRVNIAELLYSVFFIGVIGVTYKMRLPEPVIWLISATMLVLGGWLCWRRYQVQDEFGRLVFLKSWAIGGFVTMSGVSVLLLWGIYHIELPITGVLAPLPDISLWPVYACAVAGLLATGVSNLYLRRQSRT